MEKDTLITCPFCGVPLSRTLTYGTDFRLMVPSELLNDTKAFNHAMVKAGALWQAKRIDRLTTALWRLMSGNFDFSRGFEILEGSIIDEKTTGK